MSLKALLWTAGILALLLAVYLKGSNTTIPYLNPKK